MVSPGSPGGGEIYLEFAIHGGIVKVTAIDSKSGVEANVMGPSGASRAALADAAVRKLTFMLEKTAQQNRTRTQF